MKKIILTLFTVLICLLVTACESEEKQYPNPVIVDPDPLTNKTANGYKPYSAPQSSTSDVQAGSNQVSDSSLKYIGNSDTMKMHKSDCRYAKNLAEEKKVALMDYSSGISAGYTPCKVCNK